MLASLPLPRSLLADVDKNKRLKKTFRALRWVPSEPAHLDYARAQFLLIGESSGIDKAVEPQTEKQEDEKGNEEKPAEEMEKLEHEDTRRMRHLGGDASAAVFADLHARAGDYPKLQTTF